MKNFFDKFWGEKPPRKNVEPVRAKVQRSEIELYKKGDIIGGKYEVQRTLGKGGFGIVYLVRIRSSGELCAIKTFRDELLANSDAREAFKREALVWVNIEEHPFILTARWVDEFSGRLFVQMDFLNPDAVGRVNLGDHLATATGPLEPSRTLEWAIQFCMGMEHARAHGVECHRDIKPANILNDRNESLKIADFGLASASEKVSRSTESRIPAEERNGFSFSVAQGWCGTPGYIAPEVFRCEPAKPQSDIYSFGLVLWQMATGSRVPPFHVSSHGGVEDCLRAIYQRQMTEKVPSLSGPLAPIINRCLQFSPSDRFKDFDELRKELERLYEDQHGKKISVPHFGEKTATFWNNKGGSLHAVGQYQDAIVCLRRAVAINPHYAIAWSNMGHSLGMVGKHDEAIECFENALKSNLRSSNAWNNKGISLSALGRHDEAFGCFDQALEIDPQNAAAWCNKGNELSLLSRQQEAIRHYERAITIDPKYATAFRNKGDCFDKLGQHDEAIKCYDQALAIHPQYLNAWLRKAQCLSNLKRHSDAATCYEHVLRLNPRDKLTWNKRGGELWELHEYAGALECFDHALQIDSSYADAWLNKALAHDLLKQKNRAIVAFQKVIELGSERQRQYFDYARRRIQELKQEV